MNIVCRVLKSAVVAFSVITSAYSSAEFPDAEFPQVGHVFRGLADKFLVPVDCTQGNQAFLETYRNLEELRRRALGPNCNELIRLSKSFLLYNYIVFSNYYLCLFPPQELTVHDVQSIVAFSALVSGNRYLKMDGMVDVAGTLNHLRMLVGGLPLSPLSVDDVRCRLENWQKNGRSELNIVCSVASGAQDQGSAHVYRRLGKVFLDLAEHLESHVTWESGVPPFQRAFDEIDTIMLHNEVVEFSSILRFLDDKWHQFRTRFSYLLLPTTLVWINTKPIAKYGEMLSNLPVFRLVRFLQKTDIGIPSFRYQRDDIDKARRFKRNPKSIFEPEVLGVPSTQHPDESICIDSHTFSLTSFTGLN